MPNTISFALSADEGILTVTPFIDGISLVKLITEFELANGYTDPAGGYGGLAPSWNRFGPLAQYFRGETSDPDPDGKDGEIYVLACQCGEVGCWPLLALVTRVDGLYRWSTFHQPHRPERSYDDFGPFVFESSQYEAAIRNVAIRVQHAQRGS